MRPNTLHAVYTICSAVMTGGHFIATSTMQDTLAGTINALVMNQLITNTDHPAAYLAIRNIVEMCHQALVKGDLEKDGKYRPLPEKIYWLIASGEDPAGAHIPDLSDISGLKQLLAMCSLTYILSAVDIRTYAGEDSIPPDSDWYKFDVTPLPVRDRVQIQRARGLCTELLSWVDSHYTVCYNDEGGLLRQVPISRLTKNWLSRLTFLMTCFKVAADREGVEHIPGFTKDTMDIQLQAIRDKYGCVQNPQKFWALEQYISGTIKLSDVPESTRCFFPSWSTFSIQAKQRPEGPQRSSSDPGTSLEAFLDSGKTGRDELYMSFIAKRTKGVKYESKWYVL